MSPNQIQSALKTAVQMYMRRSGLPVGRTVWKLFCPICFACARDGISDKPCYHYICFKFSRLHHYSYFTGFFFLMRMFIQIMGFALFMQLRWVTSFSFIFVVTLVSMLKEWWAFSTWFVYADGFYFVFWSSAYLQSIFDFQTAVVSCGR